MKFTEQQEIESISFAARVNVASDLDTFLVAIKTEPSVQSLQNRLQENPSMKDALVRKIEHLCNLEFDARYANPHDTEVATYGWVLNTVDSVSEYIVIDLLCKLKNSLWCGRLAERLLERNRDKALTLKPLLKLFSQHLNTSATKSVLRSYSIGEEFKKTFDIDHSEEPYSEINPIEDLVESQKIPSHTLHRKIQAHLSNVPRPDGFDASSLILLVNSRSEVNFNHSVFQKCGWRPLISKPLKDQDAVSFYRHERLVA